MNSDSHPSRVFAGRTLEPGAVVAGRFVIEGVLGEGGMGRVYLAIQQPMGRRVALKVIRAELEQNEPVIKRFYREAVVISKLRHPNTITFHDYGVTEDGSVFIAMEFLEGKSLTDIMMSQGPLSLQRTVRIVSQIALSLAEAHRKGIVHRDLKPDNIFLLDMEGQPDFVKVIDFGIAQLKVSEMSTRITRTGFVCGTPEYMSPEQARGEGIDPRTDLYALGIMMYEMLEGKLPYSGDSPFAVAVKHQTEPVPFLSKSHPKAVRAFVARLMAKKPDERPNTAEDLLHELAAALPDDLSLGPVVLASLPSSRTSPRSAAAPVRPLDTNEMAQSLAGTQAAEAVKAGGWRRVMFYLTVCLGVVALVLLWQVLRNVGESTDVEQGIGEGSSPLAADALAAVEETTSPVKPPTTKIPEPAGDSVVILATAFGANPAVANREALATAVGAGEATGGGEREPRDIEGDEATAGTGETGIADGVPADDGSPGQAPDTEDPTVSDADESDTPASPDNRARLTPITIESTPPGADIFIDNRLIGITPVTIELEPGSRHGLRLRLQGFRDHREDFETPQDEGDGSSHISVHLERQRRRNPQETNDRRNENHPASETPEGEQEPENRPERRGSRRNPFGETVD